MPEGVNCKVSNCTYWAAGNRCGASSIDVRVDAALAGGDDADVEFAEEGWAGAAGDQVVSEAATCCHTFEPKREQVERDGE